MSANTLSEDELIQNWSLNDSDKRFLSKFNLDFRPWVYLQLCSLRLFGQLIDNPNTLDNAIIGYAYKSLNLPITLTVLLPDREATKTEQKKLLFQHLDFKKYDESLKKFHDWIRSEIKKGVITYEQIKPDAEAFLIKSQIALPTTYQLKRDINSFCHHSQENLFDKLYVNLPKSWITFLDELLEAPDDETTTLFQQLKDYPGSATITLLQSYLARYNKMQELDWNTVKTPEISIEFSKYLYQLGRYYDAWKIKRFRPTVYVGADCGQH